MNGFSLVFRAVVALTIIVAGTRLAAAAEEVDLELESQNDKRCLRIMLY